jgi:acetylglutamate kinase
MHKKELIIIKIGGNVIDDEMLLNSCLRDITAIKQPKILIHGGGKLATQLSAKMGIETIKVVTMVYAGYINKNIVAKLQYNQCNAIGLSGADAGLIWSHKRQHPTIDFGFVGDIDAVNGKFLKMLMDENCMPVIAPITMDKEGILLNTNADTIASTIAVAMSAFFKVRLFYCFEKKGLLRNIDDKNSVIPSIYTDDIQQLIDNKIIADGMIPKVQNISQAIAQGVDSVCLCHAVNLLDIINGNSKFGTVFSVKSF